jgi:hypothetical protein
MNRAPLYPGLGFPRFRPRHGTVFAPIQASKANATPEPETPDVSPTLRAFRHVRRTARPATHPDHPPATSKTPRDGEGLDGLNPLSAF